jgi:2-polyprenyl-3-methyl-5-hydroxy-6-metoxy-1,4-benzoquinol methylase
MAIVNPQYHNLGRILDLQLVVSPQHEKFLRRRLQSLGPGEAELLDGIAGHILNICGDGLPQFAEDYSWLCEQQLEEELFFRRNNRYRLSSFAEAYDQVYSNKHYMTRYMNGLLFTQLWWSNHTRVIEFYHSHFLAAHPEGYSHLEIGPGHGLFLYLAAADRRAGSVTGWDISEASLALTAEALSKLGLERAPQLKVQDFFKNPTGQFDSIVFSEVLEHMEHPRQALETIRPLLSDRGRLFLNMPINSPAPDHIFNVETPEDLDRFLKDAGYNVVESAYYPATNHTLETARRKKLTISCAFILERGSS